MFSIVPLDVLVAIEKSSNRGALNTFNEAVRDHDVVKATGLIHDLHKEGLIEKPEYGFTVGAIEVLHIMNEG